MNYSSEDIKRISDFQRYARFIADHFDIEIELDSTNAHTDGKVITLPNVIGLNEQELDMMYAILLHETGHIKYSEFTEEAFAKLKTKSHAFLANAIEDARIENLLMKEFGGATEIFENLYCVHLLSRKIMRRIFKIKSRQVDLFTCLGFYCHSKLINCRTAPFSRTVSRKAYVAIKEFVQANNIDSILENAPLKNWDDVIALTNKIYDLFAKKYSDKSPELNLLADIEFKKETQAKLEQLQKEISNLETKLLPKYQEYDKKSKELDKWFDDHQAEYDQLDSEKANIHEQINNENNTLNTKKSIEQNNTRKTNTQADIDKLKENINKIQSDIEEAKKQLDSKINPKGKLLTQKQAEALQKKIETRTEQKTKADSKIKANQDSLKELDKDINELTNKLSKDTLRHKTVEELKQSVDKLIDELSEVNAKEKALNDGKQDIENALQSLSQEINTATQQIQDKVFNQLYELDEKAINHEFDIGVLPEFQESPSWPEADVAQKEFDKQASKQNRTVVRNGGRMAGREGTNLRDLSVYIDNAKENVKNLDLTDIFKEKSNFSKFSSFNSNSSDAEFMTSMTSLDVMETYGSLLKHTVLTTQFDVVRTDNTSQNKAEVVKLLNEGQTFITHLKRTFAKKFKFSKKDFYKGGQEDGALDVRNIWKLATQSGDDYYEVNQKKPVNKMAASILIDVSGSQDKDETEHGKRLQMVALALSEAMKSVHIKHEILGYHAPICDDMKAVDASFSYNRKMNRLETVVYKNFAQKDNFGIGNMKIELSDNSDGESIRIAVKRLNKERSKSKALFVLTDGKPFLSNSDVNILDEDLKTALREANNQKVKIFAIGFTPNGQLFYGNRFCFPKNYEDIVTFFDKNVMI